MLILTGYNDNQAPLGDLTAPLMEAYAKRHKLGFRCVRFDATGKEAYWQKIIETLRAFDEGFDRVFWLDADQAITNPEIPPPFSTKGRFWASLDWGNDAEHMYDFSMCGWIANAGTQYIFEWVNEHHDEYISGDFPEQTPMRKRIRDSGEGFTFPRRTFNAVPDEVSPGNVPEPWQPGDFAAHITMVPLVDRVRIFHDVMRRSKQ